MKTILQKLLFLVLLLPIGGFAQNVLTGVVLDSKTKQPIAGANVVIQGTAKGISTDFDGKFKLSNLKNGDKLVFSFVSYQNKTITYNGQNSIIVSLEEAANQLEEVKVQVGYGSVKKKDATGSVSLVTSKDFNKGAIMSADQLLIGKTPGVRITTNGGAPDSDPNIRIRGGSSISGENRPLIVIDGVPIDNQNAAGNGNPLSLINPNDIDSFTILKDASSTAIYGSRASNGVILITTKRGTSGKPQYNFSSSAVFGTVQKYLNVMDGATFSKFIATNSPAFTNLLGYKTDDAGVRINDPSQYTDWQKAIYRMSVSLDNNFSVRANLFKMLPTRISFGYNNMQGLVRNNDYERYTSSIKLTPTFLKNTLKVDLNAKGIISHKNDIDAGGAIGSAVSMDPTKPIYGYSPGNRFDGYYQDFVTNSSHYQTNGATNPVALINQVKKPVDIQKLVGNVELDYKLPFFPDLRAVTNLGIETSSSKQQTTFADKSLATYTLITDPTNPISTDINNNYFFKPGEDYYEHQTITNKTMDFYLIYSKKLNGFVSKFETQAGHTFQKFVNIGEKRTFITNVTTGVRELDSDPNTLIKNQYNQTLAMESYFTRSNLDLLNKYMFTFTVRADASSLFPKDKRWGYFPAAAFAWKLKQEKFIENSKTINDLKLRVGYGLTGNSDIRGIAGYYPYSPFFAYGSSSGQYLPNVNSYTALAFNPNLTWETTSTFNVGLDFDLFKNDIITGSVDVYTKKTKNLLAKVTQPPGQMLTNEFVSNVGSTSGKGMEFNSTIKIINTKDVTFSVYGNVAYTITKVDDLSGNDAIQDSNSGLPIQTGTKLAYYKVGEQAYSAWVFEQVYDANGKPIQNAYVDRNKDGVISDADRYYQPLRPNWTYGFGYNFSLGNLDITASFRGQVGGKVYDAVMLNKGNAQSVIPTSGTSLNNALNAYIPFTNVIGNVPYSDYFLKDASFLRCESIFVSYKFKGFTKGSTLRVSTGVNNLFLLTRYKGQDPENFNAIDNNFYPRPLMTNFGLNYEF